MSVKNEAERSRMALQGYSRPSGETFSAPLLSKPDLWGRAVNVLYCIEERNQSCSSSSSVKAEFPFLDWSQSEGWARIKKAEKSKKDLLTEFTIDRTIDDGEIDRRSRILSYTCYLFNRLAKIELQKIKFGRELVMEKKEKERKKERKRCRFFIAQTTREFVQFFLLP